MKILALDTAMAACSAAVVDTDVATVLASVYQPMERGHAEAIAPMVQHVIGASGLSFTDINRIAVTTGPGTFTGVRIGLSMARGLGLAKGVPVIGIDTLRAIAANLQTPDGPLLVSSDARKDEAYTALYDHRLNTMRPPDVCSIADAARSAPAGTIVIGNAADMVISASGRRDLARADASDLPIASRFAFLAALLPASGDMPSPLYLRPPDAKPQTLTVRRKPVLTLEPATVEMADVLAGLHAACFEHGWDHKTFRDLLGMPGAEALIAVEEGTPVGFLLTRKAVDEAEIITIGTAPTMRRRGIGRRMLDHRLATLRAEGVRNLFMEVAQSNVAAQALYHSIGFKAVGRRQAYYQLAGGGREDAILMRKELNP